MWPERAITRKTLPTIGWINLKADVAIHYKLSSQLEASYSYRVGKLDNVYQRTNRFELDDYLVQQDVIQLKSPELAFKAYFSSETSGQSYNIRSFAKNLDKNFKSDDNWENLQVNLALRYDKNEYFKDQWNPRISATYTLKENHHLRVSY